VLLKFRETVLDSGKSGDTVTIPTNIEVYPKQKQLFWASIGTFLMAVVLSISASVNAHSRGELIIN